MSLETTPNKELPNVLEKTRSSNYPLENIPDELLSLHPIHDKVKHLTISDDLLICYDSIRSDNQLAVTGRVTARTKEWVLLIEPARLNPIQSYNRCLRINIPEDTNSCLKIFSYNSPWFIQEENVGIRPIHKNAPCRYQNEKYYREWDVTDWPRNMPLGSVTDISPININFYDVTSLAKFPDNPDEYGHISRECASEIPIPRTKD